MGLRPASDLVGVSPPRRRDVLSTWCQHCGRINLLYRRAAFMRCNTCDRWHTVTNHSAVWALADLGHLDEAREAAGLAHPAEKYAARCEAATVPEEQPHLRSDVGD